MLAVVTSVRAGRGVAGEGIVVGVGVLVLRWVSNLLDGFLDFLHCDLKAVGLVCLSGCS